MNATWIRTPLSALLACVALDVVAGSARPCPGDTVRAPASKASIAPRSAPSADVRESTTPPVAGAEDRARPTFVRPERAALQRPKDRLSWLDGADDDLGVLGATYKAGFDRAGARYLPFLGSHAPRNFPLRLRVASASVGGVPIAFDATAPPVRVGDSIFFERGAFTESYVLSPESIEQRFHFATLPAHREGGEVVVRIAVESELVGAESPAGLEFSNELGRVRYGRATAFDARGRTASAATTLVAGGIEIRVPAAFVAEAELPLVIDPVVSTFALDPDPMRSWGADAAYDASNDCWLVTFREDFSNGDSDVSAILLNADGGQIGWASIDASIDESWTQPAVANNNAADQFLVVGVRTYWEASTQTYRTAVHGRTVSAREFDLGPSVAISDSSASYSAYSDPDVGGDPFADSPSYYAVVWQRNWKTEDDEETVESEESKYSQLHARLVRTNGTLVGNGTLFVDVTPDAQLERPSISKSNASSVWNIVWRRYDPTMGMRIYGALLKWSGQLEASGFLIGSGLHPSASSPLADGSLWLAASANLSSNDGGWNIRAHLMSGTKSIDEVDVSVLEDLAGSNAWEQWQGSPCADSDGDVFVVAYEEQKPTESWEDDVTGNVHCATLGVVDERLVLVEGHVALSDDDGHDSGVEIAAAGSAAGPERSCLVTWNQGTGALWDNQSDVEAALYDALLPTSFCFPGVGAVPPCPCDNPPFAIGRGCDNGSGSGGALLATTGVASLTADTLVLSVSGESGSPLNVFVQGDALANSTFGAGVRCVGGTLLNLYAKNASSGAVAAPVGNETRISARSAVLGAPIAAGSTRYYHVQYDDLGMAFACGPASSVNVTQAVRVIWAP